MNPCATTTASDRCRSVLGVGGGRTGIEENMAAEAGCGRRSVIWECFLVKSQTDDECDGISQNLFSFPPATVKILCVNKFKLFFA